MSDSKKDPEPVVNFVMNPMGDKTAEIEDAQAEEWAEIDDQEEAQFASLQTAMKEVAVAEEERLLGIVKDSLDDENGILQSESIEAEIKAAEADGISTETATAPTGNDDLLPLRDLEEVQSMVEALLFMSDKPLSSEKLYRMLTPEEMAEEEPNEMGEEGVEIKKPAAKKEELFPFTWVQEAISAICDQYAHPKHGYELVEIAGGWQFRTKAGKGDLLKRLAKVQVQRLSAGALESLCIVAYKQPVLKEEIDKIRGVDSSYFVRMLMDRNLIQISGRSDLPGRPIVYTTTEEFLKLFALKDLSALPPLSELEGMVPSSETKNPEDEDPRVLTLRKMVQEMKEDRTRIFYDPTEDEKILKDIRSRIGSIATTTPYLEEQARIEKEAQNPAPPVSEQLI